MRFRPLLLGLPLLLTGCGTMSHFSWSSLSPFSWFGGSLQVSDAGVGEINAGTPLSEPVLHKALNGDYRLRGGMGSDNGQLVAFYQALDGQEVKLIISGEPKSHVRKVEVMDAAIDSQWGVKIGDAFSASYSKAFGVCQPGQGDDAQSVECVAPQSKHVSYLFSGEWSGPEGLMPPDDILKTWRVSKIIWHAQARD
ncbi:MULTISPECIES: RpoE-regulated lipoprotein [unclassified Brenneria]|uniref:RpoE-regulated lipoprotein n=1 Tax=unclassified Brenneria TaxID=2634434 RepID=UPI0015526DE6|nr:MULTISPECIES: RpoE-regulated lipoprotein [unclassified Brenneria]MBJ7222039.1 RpoE-regulated lipoprotein [Brenneria sp. L3-3C-1]MEE3643282.1 RpoE-regulated lipoprotein [Brenneria sp. L3_3C_1]MEE3650529.1 RpoE-regulated lipoprotein [Brenneria sp. HEZEL_4_2_4]NPD00484.1 RpoE-regulated lipoprotein [Brenneria sp. hezel4-2-4]